MAKEPKTLDEQVADGQRIEALLREPAVRDALTELDQQYWMQAKASTDDAATLAIVAKARALGDLSNKLDAVVHNGKIANATRERNNRR